MKKIKIGKVVVLFSLVMFFLSSCTKETINPTTASKQQNIQSMAKKTTGPSANGQGAVFLDYPGFVQGVEHFSFHANTDANGNVTGSFESKWGVNGRLHGSINCLSILPDGKTATMSGTVTMVEGETYINFGFLVGDDAWFQVRDNGEGANSTNDSFSDIFAYYDLEPCTFDYEPFLFPVVNGNVQVKP